MLESTLLTLFAFAVIALGVWFLLAFIKAARQSKTPGYKYPHRRIEKTIAFFIAMPTGFWFAAKLSLSERAALGLVYGILANYFLKMLDLYLPVEYWLLLAAAIAIGVKYGITGFAVGILGILYFQALALIMILIGGYLRCLVSKSPT